MRHAEQKDASSDAAVWRALSAIRAFSDAMDRMYGVMKGDMDMNASDLGALRMLVIREQLGRVVSPHDIARHLRISTASTTKLVDRLEAAGHVVRGPHPTDRRARTVALTAKSRRAFTEHFGAHVAAMRAVAAEYTPKELDVVSDFLARVGAAVDPEA